MNDDAAKTRAEIARLAAAVIALRAKVEALEQSVTELRLNRLHKILPDALERIEGVVSGIGT